MTVLCFVETDAGGLRDPALRALTVARSLAASVGEELVAAWVGAVETVGGSRLAAVGVDRGCAIDLGAVAGYAPVAWARALADLATTDSGEFGSVTAVLAAATDRGNEIMAHLGAITGLPMAANCVSATRVGPAQCELVRQRWAGSLLEDAALDSPLALLTVSVDGAGGSELAEAPGAAGTGSVDVPVSRFEPQVVGGDLVVRAVESADRAAGVSLATARVVVGGGRGVGGPDGFTMLEELADLLGGALGVSRVVTSQGWRPHRQQVGQTGTKISPDLYLACGISGAIQHMAGCQGAKTIVAVNTDPDAPMVAKADYAVIGDVHQVIPALIEALRLRGHRS